MSTILSKYSIAIIMAMSIQGTNADSCVQICENKTKDTYGLTDKDIISAGFNTTSVWASTTIQSSTADKPSFTTISSYLNGNGGWTTESTTGGQDNKASEKSKDAANHVLGCIKNECL